MKVIIKKNRFSLKQNLWIILLFSSFFFQLAAQKMYTVSGYVNDVLTGESMVGVKINLVSDAQINTVSNEYGFYSLSLLEGNHEIIFSFQNYSDKLVRVALTENTTKTIKLGQDVIELPEVRVKKSGLVDKTNQSSIGVERLNMNAVNKLPVLFGEKDMVKSLQLLPGVNSGGEGQSGFNVRGGTVDQNLVILDDMPIYNASHLLGFFSTFNSDIIKDVILYKGTAPAQYGGRISSVVDVRVKDGDNEKLTLNGGVGLIATRLNLEGPIQKGKSSFLISARRTYADVFLKLSETLKENKLYFFDLNTKFNYKFSDKDQLFVSAYYGRDVLSLSKRFDLNWGNTAFSLRYNKVLNDKLFSNTSLIYSNYDYEVKIDNNNNPFRIISKINTFQLKQEMQFYLNNKNDLRFGANIQFHTNNPGDISGKGFRTEYKKNSGLESALYATNDWKATDKLKINYGLRLSNFIVLPGDYYSLNENKEITDTLSFSGIVKSYLNLEPRFSFNYKLNRNSAIKFAYARNTQNLQLISNSVASTPAERWVMSNNNIKPQIGDQISLGYVKNSENKTYEFTAETYYKWMQNQIDYKDGANDRKPVIETELLKGIGRSYGIEFLIKKNTGKFTGWVGYTLSKTEKKIDGVNENNWFAARQDRTHVLNIVTLYEITRRLNVSAIWTYQTGNAVTFPSGKYNISGETYWVYTERNAYRLPDYHRLDLGVNYLLKERSRYKSELTFGLYNVYSRENTYTIDFRPSEIDPNKTLAIQTALFKIVPAITWNFKF